MLPRNTRESLLFGFGAAEAFSLEEFGHLPVLGSSGMEHLKTILACSIRLGACSSLHGGRSVLGRRQCLGVHALGFRFFHLKHANLCVSQKRSAEISGKRGIKKEIAGIRVNGESRTDR